MSSYTFYNMSEAVYQNLAIQLVYWAKERQAQSLGRRQGRKVVKHGMFLLD